MVAKRPANYKREFRAAQMTQGVYMTLFSQPAQRYIETFRVFNSSRSGRLILSEYRPLAMLWMVRSHSPVILAIVLVSRPLASKD